MLSDVAEPVALRKEREERRALSQSFGRPLASKVVLLFTALLTSGTCAWIIMQHVHRTLLFTDDESDADKQAMKIDEEVAPISVSRVDSILVTHRPLSTTRDPVVVCNTTDCEYTRWLLNISVDSSKDPCDNFYRYVCSGVTRQYPNWFIDSRGHRIPMRLSMTLNNTRMIFQALEEAEVPTTGQTAHQKAAAFYRECSASGWTAADLRYLISLLRSHQLWTTGEPPFDPLDLTVKFLVKIYLPFLFTLEVPIDQRRGGVIALMTRSKDFTNWLKELSKELKNDHRRDTIEAVLIRTQVITFDSTDANLARKIIKHENKVANISKWVYPKGKKMMLIPLAQLGRWRNDKSLSDKWEHLLRLYSGGRLPGDATVLVRRNDIELFHNLFGNGSVVKRRELKTFIAWTLTRYLHQLISLPKASLVDACASRTLTLFQHAVAYPMYSTVNKERADQVANMTDIILLEVGMSLKRSKWLDESTEKEAVRKLKLMKSFFAYPSGVNSEEGLDDLYADVPDIRGPFLKDYVNAAQAYATRNVRVMVVSSRDEIDNTAFYVPTALANVAYAKYLNAIYVSAGMMLPPAFSFGGPPEINYGAIGRLIGREMMRGYGPGARILDATGHWRKWWSTGSNREYVRRVKCHNESNGTRPSPRRTSQVPNEYLEDIMSENSLFRAYRRAAKSSPVRLGPVRGFTRDQIFYIAGCLLHCGEKAPDNDPLYFPGHRCNAAFMNDKHFAVAFHCPVNSPMNPRRKCTFW